MSDAPNGHGWWRARDGKWYPPPKPSSWNVLAGDLRANPARAGAFLIGAIVLLVLLLAAARIPSVAVILLVGFAGFVYFLPTIVAKGSGNPDQDPITILNLLLGWTFIGWVVALIWAVKEPTRGVNPRTAVQQAAAVPVTRPQQPPAGWYPDPQGVGRERWWDGAEWTEHLQL